MAVITIPHNPGLTKEQVRAAFEAHFAGKYKVEKTHAIIRDFQVVKNAFIAVSVKLDQTKDETKIVYTGFTPVWWARLLFGQLWGFIFWNALTSEIKEFIRTAPEFQPSGELVRAA
jgi:hypothetical protein